MRSEDAEEGEGEKKEEEQIVDENKRQVEQSGGGERSKEELEKIREESERNWEVVEVDGGDNEEREMFEDGDEGKTKLWFKDLLEKRSNNKNGKQQLGKEERSNIGWEEFDLEEINSGSKNVDNEDEDEELVVFDKYKETGLYVNNLNAHFEHEEEGATIRKKPRQRVNSAENKDVKRIKSEEAQKDEDGWDWREIGEGEDVKEVGSMKKKKKRIGSKKKSCRKGFHVTGCKCKPMALIADTSI